MAFDDNTLKFTIQAEDKAAGELKKLEKSLKALQGIEAFKDQKKRTLEARRAWKDAGCRILRLLDSFRILGTGVILFGCPHAGGRCGPGSFGWSVLILMVSILLIFRILGVLFV